MFHASDYRSLAEPIIRYSTSIPEKTAVIFIHDDESEESFSYGHLHENALRYAHALKKSQVNPGDIVLIALHHCPDLIWSLLGTLYIGAVPSLFMYKGPMTPVDSYIRRIKDAVQHSGTKMVIALPDFAGRLKEELASSECRIMDIDDLDNRPHSKDDTPSLDFTSGEDIAYLQYTSGTTGMRKGVMLSHRAILNFGEITALAMKLNSRDIFINWLPLYHDFGLFGGLILPILCNIPTVLMSPYKWLRKPHFFLWTIHNHKGTITFLPNSAHHHTVLFARDEDIDGLDLRSLRILYNSAEPILHRSQQLFLDRFRKYGFQEDSFLSAYGMAENTLGVTSSDAGRRAPVDWISARDIKSGKAVPAPPKTEGSQAVVSCGLVLKDTEVEIRDDHGNPLPERHIGEIAVQSSTLFSGYYKRPDLTEAALRNGWYLTGDMGYMADNELYFCGRKKDIIIVGGHNIYPEDLEDIAGTIPGILPDRSAAFGLPDYDMGTEKIIMVCGVSNSADEKGNQAIERELRRRIYNSLEVTLGEVFLAKRGWVEKTQNSKIARKRTKEKYIKFIANKKEL